MKKLAIVYDWIDKYGGAERLLKVVFDAFPEADIYTLYTDFKRADWAKKYQSRINTTGLQKIYQLIPNKKILTPLMPFFIESLDLSKYDRVISISSSFGKGVLTRPETKHVSYLFCPTRFLWQERELFIKNNFFVPILTLLRQWDTLASNRPDKILTLSKQSKKLINKYYQKEAEVLHPPFDVSYWQKLKLARPKLSLNKKFFLVVSRLEPQKRVDLAIKVFNKLKDKQLIIVGTGSKEKYLKNLAGKNIVFMKNLTDSELGWLYKKSSALIMPQSEDFGYTALESIVFETPVISYLNSGVTEFVEHGKTGYLFRTQSEEALTEALENFELKSYNFPTINWRKFESKQFINKLKSYIS